MKMHRLSLLATLVLAACGGSDDSNSDSDSGNTTPPPATVTLKGRALIDNYLSGQRVCLDANADQQCDATEATTEVTTDQQGDFTLTVPEAQQDEATQAWVIVAPQQESVAKTTEQASLPAGALLGYFDGSNYIVSPYTHQLVTSTDPELRKTQYATSIATNTKLDIADEQGLSSQEMTEQKLFGDYLAASNEESAELGQQASIKHEQQIEAAELQAQLTAELASSGNPEGWQSVTVSIRNLWQHSFHLQEMQYVRKLDVIYAKREGEIETTQYDGFDWLTDKWGNYTKDLPLQRYKGDTEKDWGKNLLREYAYWEWDYNQDGDATFKGEMAAAGTFNADENGLTHRDVTEFFNEGNPVTEGADDRPTNEFCEEFDIRAVMDNWLDHPEQAISACVSFVETRKQNKYLENNGDLVSKDIMTEWKAPEDNSDWQVNLQVAPDYHEPRTEIVTKEGDVRRITQYDWQAKSINYPDLAQSPFNVVNDEEQRHNGQEFTLLTQPMWGGGADDTLGLTVAGSGKMELQSYNPTRWGELDSSYLEQDFLKKENTYTLESRFFRLDRTTPAELEWSLDLKYAGESEPFTTQSWEYNESNMTLKATYQYRILEGEIPDTQPRLDAIMQGSPMTLVTTIKVVQEDGLDTATQTTQVDNSEKIDAPAFAQEIMTSGLKWNIVSSDPSSNELIDLLFGSMPMQFTASRDVGLQCRYDPTRQTRILQELLFAPVGGDMVVTISCQWDGGWWGRDKQYLLRMTEAYDGSRFAADLLEYNRGANIYREAPVNRYPLAFTQAQ